jgi:cell wall-associated NlpC family hydrolase
MRQTNRRIVQLAIVLLLAAAVLFMLGCKSETVRALDYSLENDLTTGDPAATPAEQTATDTPAAPEATPVPEPTPTPDASAATATPAADATPLPEMTDGTATPLPTQTPELHRLIVYVEDTGATAVAGARVTLYQDGAVLLSGMTGSDGYVSWMLPVDHAYRVTVAMSGYESADPNGKTCDMSQEVFLKMTLAPVNSDGTVAATPTPLPVPEGAPGRVTITCPDVAIQPSQAGFTLLDLVSAQTEFGEPVAVWVVDNGGFRADTAGSYTVTYGAFEEGSLVTASRVVTVEGAADASALPEEPAAPTGSSQERYEILLVYRAAVGDQLSERIAALNAEYERRINEALTANEEARILAPAAAENDTDDMTTAAQDVQQTQTAKVTNWADVLATFLALNAKYEEYPLNAMHLAQIPLDKLDSVFWDMNPIEVFRMDGTANVLLSAKTYEEMADIYGMSADRRTFLYELMQPEFRRTFASLTGSTAFVSDSQESVETLLSALPEDASVQRQQVVDTALTLVGKVSYLMGGKYNYLGWNDEWGNANVAETPGEVRINRQSGLDCSGFVSWVFVNALGDRAAVRVIGNGTRAQWANSEAIGWDEGRVGDLAFYCVPGERQYNHVGIIVAIDDDGSYLVAHCSSLQHGVVVTDGWSTGFRYLRRPAFFQ